MGPLELGSFGGCSRNMAPRVGLGVGIGLAGREDQHASRVVSLVDVLSREKQLRAGIWQRGFGLDTEGVKR